MIRAQQIFIAIAAKVRMGATNAPTPSGLGTRILQGDAHLQVEGVVFRPFGRQHANHRFPIREADMLFADLLAALRMTVVDRRFWSAVPPALGLETATAAVSLRRPLVFAA